jgi:hypothetical protein
VHISATPLLQLGDAAGMIRVGVRVRWPHVRELESQRLDVGVIRAATRQAPSISMTELGK